MTPPVPAPPRHAAGTHVLVCGGAGYIGAHMCKALAAAGLVPVTFDNLSTGHRDAVRWGPLVEGDLLDHAPLRDAFAAWPVKAVLHFAARSLVGAVIGYLSLWSVWWLFKQITGKEGMGHGDFKLLAALGAWVGLVGILPTILVSSLAGAILGSIWLATQGRDRATPIPFGPYLAIAGWITFFWGEFLVDGYLKLSGLR